MFDLLSPLFFYIGGSIGVLVPLVLHLIQSKRTVRVKISTTRFLRLAQEKASRRIKLENILLWILRTALLVMLALAFAMPMLRSKRIGKWFGRSPRDVAIVIDGSYSMDYNLGRSTVWEKAIDAAVSIVEGLSEQDRLCVFVARDRVDPVIEQLSGDREEVLGRLKALTLGQTASDLAPAIMDANASLKEAKRRREREIHIITDTQALPWDSFGREAAARDADKPGAPGTADGESGADGEADAIAAESGDEDADTSVSAVGAWDPSAVDKRTVVFVSQLGVSGPENLSPTKVEIEPSLLLANHPAKARVRLSYTGPPKSTTATLYINDEEVGNRSATLGTDQAAELVFPIPPLPPGRHAARVQMPDDNLLLDNAFHLVLKVEDQFPTLCVGSRDDTLFARAALMAGRTEGGGIEADWVAPGQLGNTDFSKYACIFLCNAIPLSAGEVSSLEAFAESGGLLVFFPGERAAAIDYQAWGCLPGVPAAIADVALVQRKRSLHWDMPHHAVLEPLLIGGSTLSVTARRQLVWDTFAERAERLVSIGAEHAFLVGRPHGQGYVLMFAVSADRTWSDFPLSPFYLPVVHQIVEFGAGVGSNLPYVWCTHNQPLNRILPEATRGMALQGSDGKSVVVRSAVAATEPVLHVEDLMHAGVYTMADPETGRNVPALAVNMERRESNLTPLDPAEIYELLKLKNVNVAHDLEELGTQIRESRVGRTFGEQLLWLVLILAAAEFFYANRLTKEAPSLSGVLGIEASGKTSGSAAAAEGGSA
jgi:hypothetical protein